MNAEHWPGYDQSSQLNAQAYSSIIDQGYETANFNNLSF